MQPLPPTRFARLVLITRTGSVLGSLEPYAVETPWWNDMAPVVEGARRVHGVEVVVLRMLESELPCAHGGLVTYLAQVAQPVSATPWHGELSEHPLRLSYAHTGGPQADLAWAARALADEGLVLTQTRQVRTWNLSSLWQLSAGEHHFWLKVVPGFFAHEGTLLGALNTSSVPRLVAHEGARMLMRALPGDDLYGAELPMLMRMLPLVVGLQHAWSTRCDELLALGLFDYRARRLESALVQVVERNAAGLTVEDAATLSKLLAGLPARMKALGECGLPDTLVHGDLHPGNFRGDEHTLALLDWGDASVGHPLLDQAAFVAPLAPHQVEPVRDAWFRAWQERIPGCDPARAARLLAPLAAARQAAVYQLFLDHIEPAEHGYHRQDPGLWLARAARLTREESSLAPF